jgi:predicted DNA-binding transcriptional regulator YafY
MTRAERLLALMDALRRRRRPVTGTVLAGELGVSLRTLYRDMASLQAQGVPVEGEAGLGYLLRPGFFLPPMTLGEDETEALVLGAKWVTGHADPRLAAAAATLLARIRAVLPPDRADAMDTTGFVVPPIADPAEGGAVLTAVREAMRRERKLRIAYDDGAKQTERTVWPVSIAFFERVRVLAAWCELRTDFRHFRTDRIVRLETLPERFPRRRAVLLRAWRATLPAGVPE